MSRIEAVFKELRNKRAAFIPFIVAGDPDLKTTETLVLKMRDCGADIIEIGVPFSDPLADGPTIQAASQRALNGVYPAIPALQGGGKGYNIKETPCPKAPPFRAGSFTNSVNLDEIFRMAERLKGISTPRVLMTYFNPVFQYGLRSFAEDCHRQGIEGVIIPDLPPEEAGPWIKEAKSFNLDTIFLIAPTSSPDRIRSASRYRRGFLYYVSITGVTGTRGKLPEELGKSIGQIKKYSNKPVAVGFGISTPEQVKEVGRIADGVIVGSAIVKLIEENLEDPNLITRVGNFVASLIKVLKS